VLVTKPLSAMFVLTSTATRRPTAPVRNAQVNTLYRRQNRCICKSEQA
jgi:hypothetical protein